MTDAMREHRTDRLDAYMWRHIAHHLVEAGRANELRDLLLDPVWLQRKLEATDVGALLGDFTHLPADEPVHEVAAALRLSAHIIGGDPSQLPGQLVGRLGDSTAPEIRRLLDRIATTTIAPYLRPARATLTPPGAGQLITLLGHTGPVSGIAMTADGRRALSGGVDGTLRLWDLIEGRALATITTGGRRVVGVAMSADATRAVSVAADATVTAWDLVSATPIGDLVAIVDAGPTRFRFHDRPCVAMSAAGNRALSADGDTLQVWDLDTGTLVTTLTRSIFATRGAAMSADGSRAASIDTFANVTVWDLPGGGAQTLPSSGGMSFASALAMTGDGNRIVSSANDGLAVWDVPHQKVTATLTFASESVTAVAVSPDGTRAVSAHGDGAVLVWDLATGTAIANLAMSGGPINAIAMSADATRAVSAGEGGITVWDLTAGGSGAKGAGPAQPVNAVAVAADGSRALSGDDDGVLTMWDPATGTVTGTLAGHADAPDGELVTFRVRDTDNGTSTTRTTRPASIVFGVALTANGSRAVSGAADGRVRVWDLDAGTATATLSGHKGSVWAVALTADGASAASAGEDGTAKVWDLARGSAVAVRRRGLRRRITMKLHDDDDSVNAIAISGDGRRGVVGGDDEVLTVWEVGRRRPTATLAGHRGPIRAVAITADGSRAVSAGADHTVRVWDLARRTLVGTLVGHRGSVRGVAITNDGRRAVSAGTDRTVTLWDLDTCTPLATFAGDGEFEAVAIDGRGRVIVCGDRLGGVHHLVFVDAGPSP